MLYLDDRGLRELYSNGTIRLHQRVAKFTFDTHIIISDIKNVINKSQGATGMKIQNNEMKDEGLKGNEKIEEAISALQQEPSQELLAHALTIIRRRMKEEGQLILAVEPSVAEQLKIQAVKTADGKKWWSAFTSFEEELKGSDSVMSTFLTAIEPLFQSAVQENEIEGIILNPWNRTIMLDKTLLKLILGESGK